MQNECDVFEHAIDRKSRCVSGQRQTDSDYLRTPCSRSGWFFESLQSHT